MATRECHEVTCILCGAVIPTTGEAWLREFRALYSDDYTWENPKISGIGDRGSPFRDLVVPVAFDAHIDDDPHLDSADTRYVNSLVLIGYYLLLPPGAWPMNASGFFGHASCWALLSDFLQPRGLNPKSLSLLCLSSPARAYKCLDFGIDYGDVYKFDRFFEDDIVFEEIESRLAPRKDRVISKGLTQREIYDSTNHSIYFADPLQVPKLVKRQEACKESPHIVNHNIWNSNQEKSPSTDFFSRFPFEIQEHILCVLPSKDVLNLKLASRTFAWTIMSKRFWASRFDRGCEYHCLKETADDSFSKYDWKASFFQAKSIQATDSFRNRKRILSLILQICELLRTIPPYKPLGLPCQAYMEVNEPHDSTAWRKGRIKLDPFPRFLDGPRALYIRNIAIPLPLRSVHVTLLKILGLTYVSGLRFESNAGLASAVGYVMPEYEVCISLENSTNRNFAGFKLAVGPSGVSGIGILTGSGDTSTPMVGDSENPEMLLKALLDFDEGFLKLKCGFDAMKLVSIAFPREIPDGATDFRNDFPWFPNVPGPDLHLCECPSSKKLRDYEVLRTCMFGGHQGTFLRNLIGVAVFERRSKIHGIDFLYDSAINGTKVVTLGRSWPSEPLNPSQRRLCNLTWSKRTIFEVDGPGGEIITGLDGLRNDNFDVNSAFRIHTSYGRTCFFPQNVGPESLPQLTPVKVPEPTKIIGFYAGFLPDTTFSGPPGLISKQI